MREECIETKGMTQMFSLEFRTRNEAFGETPGDKATEVARILRSIADRLEAEADGGTGKVRDLNGNAVGQWTLLVDDE
jgi:hypothetical protein